MNLRCVISGSAGTGKSTLIKELKRHKGIWVSEENSKKLSTGKYGGEGKRLWKEFISEKNQEKRKQARLRFEDAVLEKDIATFKSAPVKKFNCFFDCGVVETYAYLKRDGVKIPKRFSDSIKKYKYDIVFFAPIWPRLFKHVAYPAHMVRARQFDRILRETYQSMGCKAITLPKESADERATFVVRQTQRFTAEK